MSLAKNKMISFFMTIIFKSESEDRCSRVDCPYGYRHDVTTSYIYIYEVNGAKKLMMTGT